MAKTEGKRSNCDAKAKSPRKRAKLSAAAKGYVEYLTKFGMRHPQLTAMEISVQCAKKWIRQNLSKNKKKGKCAGPKKAVKRLQSKKHKRSKRSCSPTEKESGSF